MTIQGDGYQLSVSPDGFPQLRRYNKTYQTWVTLEFLGNQEGLESWVQAQLKSQYIQRVLEKLADGGLSGDE